MYIYIVTHTKTSGGRTKQKETADTNNGAPFLSEGVTYSNNEYSDPMQSRELEKEGGGSHLGGGRNSKYIYGKSK